MFFFPGMTFPKYEVAIDAAGQATYTPQGTPHRMRGHRKEWKQRDPEQSPPTQKQIAFLQKLMLSHAFSDKEVEDAEDWMYSDKATEAAMSRLIDRAKQRLDDQKARQKSSDKRKAKYRHRKKK